MTNEEYLAKIGQEIHELITKKYPNVGFFIAIDANDVTMYIGNRCPLCAIGNAAEWAEENNLTHNEGEAEEIDPKKVN